MAQVYDLEAGEFSQWDGYELEDGEIPPWELAEDGRDDGEFTEPEPAPVENSEVPTA